LLTNVGLVSHLIAAIGFGALAATVLWRRNQTGTSLWLVIAALMTMAWAGTFVLAVRYGGLYFALLSPMETLRTASWIAFVVALLRVSWQLDTRLSSSFVVASAIGFITALQLVLDIAVLMGSVPPATLALVAIVFLVSRMTVAISGLVLIHNLYINADPLSRPGIRLLCIGLAGFFAYDLNLYTFAFLLGHMSEDLYNIRGAVDAIVIPLLLLSSSRTWVARVQVSRQVVFHTLSFSMIGAYLIAMALVAYGLRLVGGNWGLLLQISFLFATIILAVVVIVSPRFRAAMRVQIAKNFFAYKYDYRQEWLRFITTVSQTDDELGHLSERVVQAVCVVVDSPGGILYTPDDDGGFDVAARWNMGGFAGGAIAASSDFATFLSRRQRIVDFDELRVGLGDYDGMPAPDWALADRRVWLAVPLLHLEHLAGFLLLERTVAPRELNWEDFDVLRTLGRQSASYIAEASSQAALDEAGKFDEFNRRFAFIMHDIKNLVSQLSLVARNAERHADNPAFRADMVATLQSSVGKMNDLLARLAQHSGPKADIVAVVDLAGLATQVIEAKRLAYPALSLTVTPADSDCFDISGDPGRLEQLFAHLVQNAIDASTAESTRDAPPVMVSVVRDGTNIVVKIIDHGVGMSPAFVRSELFKPFRSTKPGGFGIGAYEAREIARGFGGRLDVTSRQGAGTSFTVTLPAMVVHDERTRMTIGTSR
jgi:putative PEP-CTERM system histidine kinase